MGGKHLPHDTSGRFFRLQRVNMVSRSFLRQARVMKATRPALVAKLVVVIDDDPLILEATEGLLRSWGCCVVAAHPATRPSLKPKRVGGLT